VVVGAPAQVKKTDTDTNSPSAKNSRYEKLWQCAATANGLDIDQVQMNNLTDRGATAKAAEVSVGVSTPTAMLRFPDEQVRIDTLSAECI
jgi:hypothetical protein